MSNFCLNILGDVLGFVSTHFESNKKQARIRFSGISFGFSLSINMKSTASLKLQIEVIKISLLKIMSLILNTQ